MSTKVSKFRLSKATASKKDQSFLDAKPTGTVWDLSNTVAASSSLIALPWATVGGGKVAVLKQGAHGKLPSKVPCLLGHTAPVIDIAFNPFVNNLLATASEDATIRLWSLPESGITEDVSESSQTLTGHSKKVGILAHHPSAAHVMLSAAMDNIIKLWDVEKGVERCTNSSHTDQILSVNFNLDGSLINTTSKDKKLRVLDLRQNRVVGEAHSHEGLKAQRSVWAKRLNVIVTTGFNKEQHRHLIVWDPRNLSRPLHNEEIDRLSGVFMPLYDEDLSLLYLAGKGESSLRMYELLGDKQPIVFCQEHPGQDTQRGVAFLPKASLNVKNGEIAKIVRATPSLIQTVTVAVSRKSSAVVFQEDIYPPTFAPEPSLSADEFFSGANAAPKTMDLRPLFDSAIPVVLASSPNGSPSPPSPATPVSASPPQSASSPTNATAPAKATAVPSTLSEAVAAPTTQPEKTPEPEKAAVAPKAEHPATEPAPPPPQPEKAAVAPEAEHPATEPAQPPPPSDANAASTEALQEEVNKAKTRVDHARAELAEAQEALKRAEAALKGATARNGKDSDSSDDN